MLNQVYTLAAPQSLVFSVFFQFLDGSDSNRNFSDFRHRLKLHPEAVAMGPWSPLADPKSPLYDFDTDFGLILEAIFHEKSLKMQC